MDLIEKLGKTIGKYFAILVIITAAIALNLPSAFIWVKPHITLLLGIIMFGMGMTLRKDDFKEVFTRPKDVLIGLCAHYIIMPSVAFALAKIFNLPTELAVGLILVGCCPSGTASNVMCFLAKGDLALAVSIGAVSTLIAPIVMPFLILLLAGKMVEIKLAALAIDIVKVVILPIVLGVIVNTLSGENAKKATKALPFIANIAIILIVGGVVAANSKRLLSTALIAIVVVVLHNLFGFLFGYLTSKALGLSEAKRRAVTFEVGMQNSALGVSLAMSFFSPAAAIPAAIFSVWHNISGPTLASFWSTRAPKGKKDEKLEGAVQ